MKLLVLAPILPDSAADGDKLRLHHFLRLLAPKHRVTLLCFRAPGEKQGSGELAKLCRGGVHSLTMASSKRWINALLHFWGDIPINVGAYSHRGMEALVEKTVSEGKFDAVLAYRLRMAPYALHSGVKRRFLDFTDSMFQYFRRRAAAEKNLFKRWIWSREARRLLAYEAGCALQFNACFINAEQDAKVLGEASGKKPLLAPNGVDTRWFHPVARNKRDSHRLVFVGNLAYAPNVDGLLWFGRQVLPLLKVKDPQVKLSIVGGNAPVSLKRLAEAESAVQLEGFLADTRPLQRRAAASICPVRIAAGRQNKILEAFALGTPVVATSLTAEGVEAKAEKEVLVADEPSKFALQCWRLMSQPRLGTSLARKARAMVARKYQWRKSASVMDKALRGRKS